MAKLVLPRIYEDESGKYPQHVGNKLEYFDMEGFYPNLHNILKRKSKTDNLI